MASDEPNRPRKTLTVKKTARDAHAEESPKRARSGARARLVAQIERDKEKRQRLQEAAAPETSRPPRREPQEHRRGAPAGAARGPARPDAARPDAARPDAARPDAIRSDASRPGKSRPGAARPNTARPAHPRDDLDYVAPAASAGGFHDPFEDDGPAPEFAPAPENWREAEHVPVVEKRSRRPRTPRPAETFKVFAPCPQGLEEALTAEMQALGYEDAQAGRAGCSFTADWSGVQRANLYSRLATRILVQVAHAEISHEDDILDLARATPWERWFGPEQTLRVDTSAVKSPVQSLQYCNLRAKDGICDRLREVEGARPDIDTVRPDARVHLFLTGHTATLYLDTSGESLFKRGWRLDKGEAPLRENLAAGMLALAGWDPAAPLLDPFCGSGTILIEAAWIALGVPPGISRPFGFERLRGHDAYRWRDLKNDARARILPQIEQPLVGYDLDPRAVEFARANAERAWLTADTIRFEVGDARDIPAPADHGWIVTNPPYGERMQAEQQEGLWRAWSSCLKRNFAGWQLHVITSDMSLPQQLRLKPRRRIPLHNGALDCRLFGFELVAASYRDR